MKIRALEEGHAESCVRGGLENIDERNGGGVLQAEGLGKED